MSRGVASEDDMPGSPLSMDGYHSDHSQINDSAVLDEDSAYEPAEDEVREYAQFLGMDLDKHSDLLWIAREGLKAPLPAPWKPCKTKEDPPRMYYFNFETGESSWEYPCDKQYKQLFLDELEKRDKQEVSIKLFASDPLNPQVEVADVGSHSEPIESGKEIENVSPRDKLGTKASGIVSPGPSAEKVRELGQVAALEKKLREMQTKHGATVAGLTAEIARLADELSLSESKRRDAVAELAAARVALRAATAQSEAAAKANLGAVKEDASPEILQATERGERDEQNTDTEQLRLRLDTDDREWNDKLASVKAMVAQIKGYFDNDGPTTND